MRYRGAMVVALLLMCALSCPARAQVDIEHYIRSNEFNDIKLSPAGDYYAATVPLGDRTGLAVLRRADKKVTASFTLGKNRHVEAFWWVNPSRLLISISEKYGSLDQPVWTGELYAIDFDGKRAEMLVGYRLQGDGASTSIKNKKAESVMAFLVDDLPGDDKNVIISVSPLTQDDPWTRAERMDVYTGRRVQVARAPVKNATFTTDHDGVVRFASGFGQDSTNKLYYRVADGAQWQLLNDEATSHHIEYALGFSADNRTAYLQVDQAQGPDALVAYEVASGVRKELLRDATMDPQAMILSDGTPSVLAGAVYHDGKPRTRFFDEKSATAKLYRALEAAFAGNSVFITSSTADGKQVMVRSTADRNPGDFYVFDTTTKQAAYVLSRRNWIDPEKMAEMRPITLKARDGLVLQGFLTLPKGDAKSLSMVVMPHGGPYGIHDDWSFATDSQVLAAAGYAVLQVNYRGSGGRGRAFQQAGAREWGDKMQDDLTDATRWAINEGIAASDRICIYGASYGGYAALMGVAKEPGLYRCAAGYVGVYDLAMMQREDGRKSKRLGNWSQDWVGNDVGKLAAASPNLLADRIKVPVFLAAGGEDEIAPIEHSKKMEQALRKAGVPVETLYYPNEGHGFYAEAHRREFYDKLLAFLARNIGVDATVGKE